MSQSGARVPPIAVACLATLLAASTPRAAPVEAPVDTVRVLYHDFAWEASATAPAGAVALSAQPRRALVRYFTPRLAGALAGDAACTGQTHGICRLDFAPLWDSQDPQPGTIGIESGPGEDRVTVRIHQPALRDPLRMQYRLVHLAAGWRIADILYADGRSLRALLDIAD